MNDNLELAAQQAAGLRQLADMIEQNPELATNFDYTLNYSGISLHLRSNDRATEMANIARIARRYGAKTTKDIGDDMYNLVCDFGGVKAKVLAYRNEVCERVVTGTHEVTEEVPDPVAVAALPKVKQTRVEEIVEWKCRPLLAADTETAVA